MLCFQVAFEQSVILWIHIAGVDAGVYMITFHHEWTKIKFYI